MAVLKETVSEKGFSLLTIDPTDTTGTSSVYIHEKVANPGVLERAAAVAFKPHKNARGQLQASAPVWILMGRPEAITWGAYLGTVSNDVSTGNAYVQNSE